MQLKTMLLLMPMEFIVIIQIIILLHQQLRELLTMKL